MVQLIKEYVSKLLNITELKHPTIFTLTNVDPNSLDASTSSRTSTIPYYLLVIIEINVRQFLQLISVVLTLAY